MNHLTNILLFWGIFKTRMNSNLKTIDFSHLNSIACGDDSFKIELIGIFLEQIPVFIHNMKKYLDNNKLEKLAREAHTAKSSVLIFGMTNSGRLLKEIQLLAESKKPTDIQQALEEVEIELKQAKIELKDFLKKG
jgi:HPt (histidine-containing phosphotransfer) domain-containing protein